MYCISYMTGFERKPGRGEVSMPRGFPSMFMITCRGCVRGGRGRA